MTLRRSNRRVPAMGRAAAIRPLGAIVCICFSRGRGPGHPTPRLLAVHLLMGNIFDLLRDLFRRQGSREEPLGGVVDPGADGWGEELVVVELEVLRLADLFGDLLDERVGNSC